MAAATSQRPRAAGRPPRSEVKGICATCINYPVCQFTLRAGQLGVFYCNEFDYGEKTERRMRHDPLPGPHPVASEEAPAAGLCGNCDVRGTCTYLKPPGGVWHCNEYR